MLRCSSKVLIIHNSSFNIFYSFESPLSEKYGGDMFVLKVLSRLYVLIVCFQHMFHSIFLTLFLVVFNFIAKEMVFIDEWNRFRNN
jgi:hypothetical protein